jgi:hypothetical protein
MTFLFNTVGGVNGFDQFGHFLRATPKIPPGCTRLSDTTVIGCEANWGEAPASKAEASKLNSPASVAQRWRQAYGDDIKLGPTGQPVGAGPSMDDARALLDTVIGKRQPSNRGGGQ